MIKQYGYTLNRADRMGKTGMIINHIIKQLFDSDLVIADLTDFNANVFYELAIRHITQKPCIQMMKRGQKVPFDVSGIETIFFDIDLANAEFAKNELCKQIELIEQGKFNKTNPITPVSENLLIQKALNDSTKDLSENEILHYILETVDSLTYETVGIRNEISSLRQNRRSNYSDLKRDSGSYSIDQELQLLTNIFNHLTCELEELKKTIEPGEGWAIAEAGAEIAVIENRIKSLQHLMND